RSTKYGLIIAFELLVVLKNASAQGIDLRILEAVNPQYPTSQYWKYTSTSAYVFSGVATVTPFVYGLVSGDRDAQYKSYNIMIAMGLDIVAQEGLKLAVNRERPGDA